MAITGIIGVGLCSLVVGFELLEGPFAVGFALLATVPSGLFCLYSSLIQDNLFLGADIIHNIILFVPQMRPALQSMYTLIILQPLNLKQRWSSA